jgi:hypothetical protein
MDFAHQPGEPRLAPTNMRVGLDYCGFFSAAGAQTGCEMEIDGFSYHSP